MAMRAAAKTAATVAPRGLRSLLFSTSNFPFNLPQTPTEKPPSAEPSTNLFVSGLNKRTTTEGLQSAFEKFGQVIDAKVVTDRVSGFSKGFGFVRYASLEDAAAGIKGMDGQSISSNSPFLPRTYLGISTVKENSVHVEWAPNSRQVYDVALKDSKFLEGWVIFAEYARPRNPPPPSQNSFSYGGNNTRFQG